MNANVSSNDVNITDQLNSVFYFLMQMSFNKDTNANLYLDDASVPDEDAIYLMMHMLYTNMQRQIYIS